MPDSVALMKAVLDGPWLIPVAFVGGVVSSLLPCTLGMLPILMGYMGAYAEGRPLAMLEQSALFVAGNALTLSVLGIIAALAGITFGSWDSPWLYGSIGLFAVVMGLITLGWLNIPLPGLKKIPELPKHPWLAPFVLGAIFGLSASPCGTPYLALILSLMAYEGDVLRGALALFAYALGQGVLVMIVGLGTGLLRRMAVLRHVGRLFTMLSGWLFIGVGLVFVLLALGWLS